MAGETHDTPQAPAPPTESKEVTETKKISSQLVAVVDEIIDEKGLSKDQKPASLYSMFHSRDDYHEPVFGLIEAVEKGILPELRREVRGLHISFGHLLKEDGLVQAYGADNPAHELTLDILRRLGFQVPPKYRFIFTDNRRDSVRVNDYGRRFGVSCDVQQYNNGEPMVNGFTLFYKPFPDAPPGFR